MLLLALSLALSQLLLAVHEVHHFEADHDEERCELCLIGGGLGQSRPADTAVFGAVSPDRLGLLPTPHYATTAFPAGYRPRAPPFPRTAVVMV